MELLLFFGSALLAAAFGVGVASSARVRDTSGFLVAVLVGAAAQLVLITELLSLLSFWRSGALVAAQLLSLLPLWLLHRRLGGELPVANLRAAFARLHPRALLALARREPLALAVVLVAGFLLLIELYESLAVAPNTWDSMTYHLSRIVYWMQNDSVMQYANGSERQSAFPINAEVLQGWTMLLSGGDRFVQSIQWVAQLGVAFAVVAASRDFGYRLRDGVVAAAAFLAMPIAVAEATSSQNDMVLAFFAVAALLFLVRGLNGDRPAQVLMAIAGGLMFGTKSNGMLLAASLGVAALVVVGRDLKRLFRPALLAVVGVLVFGMFTYGQNVIDRGSFIGTDIANGYRIDSLREVPLSAIQTGWLWVASVPDRNLARVGTELELAFNSSFVKAAQRFDGLPDQPIWLEFNPSLVEDVVAGGLPLLLLILPGVLLALMSPRSREQVASAAAVVTAVLLMLLTLRYNHWIGRFVLAPAAFGAPLVARLATTRAVHGLALVLLILTTTTIGVGAQMKSLVPYNTLPALVGADRVAQQTVIKTDEAAPLLAVERLVPKGSRLGIAGYEDGWEYPYAGADFGRTLVRIPEGKLPRDVFERYDLDALLISNTALFTASPFKPTFKTGTHQLILRPEPEQPKRKPVPPR